MAPFKKSMVMVEMLPKDGLFYKFIDDVKKAGARCILPGWEAAEIMMALNNKYPNATKKDFDQEIAMLFQKGTDYVRHHLAVTGDPVPYGAHFWVGAVQGTMFYGIHPGTVYRFALKIIEAREAWIDDKDGEQILRQAPYQCQTAQAVDRFNGMVTAAGVMHGDQAFSLAEHMIGDVAEQIDEEDTAFQVQYMVEKDEDYKIQSEGMDKPSPPTPVIHTTELNAQQSVAEDSQNEEMMITEGGQDEEMNDAETGGYGDFLAKLALEDAENADEEDMMELE